MFLLKQGGKRFRRVAYTTYCITLYFTVGEHTLHIATGDCIHYTIVTSG